MEAKVSTYPKWVTCRNFFDVEIRPMRTSDIDPLVEMLRSLEEKDLARLPCDVMNSTYPETVRQQLKDGSVHRLLAWHGINEVAGALALYLNQTYWYSHTARIIQVTHPEYRRYGVATVLFDEMIPLAESLDIRKLYTELTDAHREGIKMVRAIGFRREARLTSHVRDSATICISTLWTLKQQGELRLNEWDSLSVWNIEFSR